MRKHNPQLAEILRGYLLANGEQPSEKIADAIGSFYQTTDEEVFSELAYLHLAVGELNWREGAYSIRPAYHKERM